MKLCFLLLMSVISRGGFGFVQPSVIIFRASSAVTNRPLTFHSRALRTTQLQASTNDATLGQYLWTFGPFGASTVLVWRGIWDLQDVYLLPTHPVASAIASLLIAIACSAFILVVNNKTIPTAVSTLLMAVASVCYWRGCWELWDVLVFVDAPVLQHVAGLAAGCIVLLSTQTFRLGVVSPPIILNEDDNDAQLRLLSGPLITGDEQDIAQEKESTRADDTKQKQS